MRHVSGRPEITWDPSSTHARLREIDGAQATARPLAGRGMVQAGCVLGINKTRVLAMSAVIVLLVLLSDGSI
jgi:hypothetical protein